MKTLEWILKYRTVKIILRNAVKTQIADNIENMTGCRKLRQISILVIYCSIKRHTP